MDKLHISQDDYGYWMLSLEKEDGTLSLLAYQSPAPHDVYKNVAKRFPDAAKIYKVK
jgi:hypothetical protein